MKNLRVLSRGTMGAMIVLSLLLLYQLVLLPFESERGLATAPAHSTVSRAGAGHDGEIAESELGSEAAWSGARSNLVAVKPGAELPNHNRDPDWDGSSAHRYGMNSPYYGDIQRHRQEWLMRRIGDLRSGSTKNGGGGAKEEGEREGGEPPTSGDAAAVDDLDVDVGVGIGAEVEGGTAARSLLERRVDESTNKSYGFEGYTGTMTAENRRKRKRTTVTTTREGQAETAGRTKVEAGGEPARGVGGEPAREVGGGDGAVEDGSSVRGVRSQRNHGRHMVYRSATRLTEGKVGEHPRTTRPTARSASKEAEEADPGLRVGIGDRGETAAAAAANVTVVFPWRSAEDPEEYSRRRQASGPERIGHSGGDTRGGKRRGTANRGKRGLSNAEGGDGDHVSLEERIAWLERGAELWSTTYVPPVEPAMREELVRKWSGRVEESADEREGEVPKAVEDVKGRLLYVITSFDRGHRLGAKFKGVDKADYILLMMDEMREACEAGFSPQVHLIAAWDPSQITDLARDRLFCARTGRYVPYSYEEHSPKIQGLLSVKHRIYMKSRLESFDVFLQVEDDMILTLNHIMLYQEESERLVYRRGKGRAPDFQYAPGFMRVEPGSGEGNSEILEWFEWEIILSRFYPMKINQAGTYIRAGPSKVLKNGGNNQGMWMATREQLRILNATRACSYLNFDENSTIGHVETHSGSIQMFSQQCRFIKVFPATHFEDFLVHHRTNNKNGHRGESIPAVPISMLRLLADQYMRDEIMLEVHSRA